MKLPKNFEKSKTAIKLRKIAEKWKYADGMNSQKSKIPTKFIVKKLWADNPRTCDHEHCFWWRTRLRMKGKEKPKFEVEEDEDEE